MANRGISVGVEITGNAKGFKAASEDAQKATESLRKKANASNREIEQSFKMMSIAVAKVAGAIYVVKEAFDVYAGILKSTGATGDEFEFTMQGVNDQLNYIKVSLATMDFDGFIANMKKAYEEGRRYAGIIDELDDQTRALGYAEADAIMTLAKLNDESAQHVKGSKEQIGISEKIIKQEEKLASIRLGIAEKAYQNELTHITAIANNKGKGNLVTEKQIDLYTRMDPTFIKANGSALRYNQAVREKLALDSKILLLSRTGETLKDDERKQYQDLTAEITNTDANTKTLAGNIIRLAIPTDQQYTTLLKAYNAQEQARASNLVNSEAAQRRLTAAQAKTDKTELRIDPKSSWGELKKQADTYYASLSDKEKVELKDSKDNIDKLYNNHFELWKSLGTGKAAYDGLILRMGADNAREAEQADRENKQTLLDQLTVFQSKSKEQNEEFLSSQAADTATANAEGLKWIGEQEQKWIIEQFAIADKFNKKKREAAEQNRANELSVYKSYYDKSLIDEATFLQLKADLDVQAAEDNAAKIEEIYARLYSDLKQLEINMMEETVNQLAPLQNILSDSFDTLFQGNKDGWQDMINNMISSFRRLVAEILAKKAILALAKLLTSGSGSGVAGGTVTRGIDSFADGGIVSGPTIARVAEYSGAKSNPEVIAPLSDLKGLLGSTTSGQVTFRIEGDTLVGVLGKQNRKVNSFA